MNTQTDILRLLRNLICIDIINAVDLGQGLCRVEAGNSLTDRLPWLTCRTGRSRSWRAPSEREPVLILALGGELDTAFALPGIFSDDFPALSVVVEASELIIASSKLIMYLEFFWVWTPFAQTNANGVSEDNSGGLH